MSGTGSRLAGRYRKLLRGYPRAYRRERGEEIVNTLLALAPDGRTRPTLREVVNLVGHGLRARLGRPASRSVVVWAGLAALMCGLFTAAVATRVAWETARALPDVVEAGEIFRTVLPEYDLTGKIDRSPAMFVVYGQPLTRQNVDTLLFGDGGEYGFGLTSASADGSAPASWQHSLAVAQQRLRDTGWRVLAPVTRNVSGCDDDSCDTTAEPTWTTLTARRADNIIEIEFFSDPTFDTTGMTVGLSRATPWAVHPAGVVAGLLGALFGWLLFGWASRRTESRHPALRATATLSYAMTMFFWIAPILLFARYGFWHSLTAQQLRWQPLWEWLGQPTASLPFLVGCVMALAGLALAALPRVKPDRAKAVATH